MTSVGILGYGHTGQYLAARILRGDNPFDLSFVWNRDPARLEGLPLPPERRLSGDNVRAALEGFAHHHPMPDLLVEVCHPQVIATHGPWLLEQADLFIASITVFADAAVESALRDAAAHNPAGHGVYLPSGAAWGVQDVLKMDQLGTLQGLTVSMTFHADALRLREPLAGRLQTYISDPTATAPLLLYEGPVRGLAPLAPNNVNTMTCLALAASRLGLDGTRANLLAQKDHDAHVVDIEVLGPGGFSVRTTRTNPAKKGAVTGDQTYGAFWMSLLMVGGRGNGVFFC